MTNNNSHLAKTPRLHLAVCMVGLFLALFASYAQGQQVHQLLQQLRLGGREPEWIVDVVRNRRGCVHHHPEQ